MIWSLGKHHQESKVTKYCNKQSNKDWHLVVSRMYFLKTNPRKRQITQRLKIDIGSDM